MSGRARSVRGRGGRRDGHLPPQQEESAGDSVSSHPHHSHESPLIAQEQVAPPPVQFPGGGDANQFMQAMMQAAHDYAMGQQQGAAVTHSAAHSRADSRLPPPSRAFRAAAAPPVTPEGPRVPDVYPLTGDQMMKNYTTFIMLGPKKFFGRISGVAATEWVLQMEKLFKALGIPDCGESLTGFDDIRGTGRGLMAEF